ncbi:MAG: hypothetical protein IJ944_01365 [Clostridia bacterium]|nr:hypothetical protein [Clostridia bacterium]
MQDIIAESIARVKKLKLKRMRLTAVLLVLSLVVSLDVFWALRQPGLTLAGDADCGFVEHSHDEKCQSGDTPCPLVEHIHTIDCYSDETADVESQLVWQQMFSGYPYSGNLCKDLVGIAKMQVGYKESKRNFEINQEGIRHGYTRYGDWYGTPYTNWSATFVSFCLHYAGADANEFPSNTGALSMADQWRRKGRFEFFGHYTPVSGDLVFFKDNTVGIIAEVQSSTMQVIRGDINDAVTSSSISLKDNRISGWGLVSAEISKHKLLDISNGPAVFIFEGKSTYTESTSTMQVINYALRSSSPAEDLDAYLKANGGEYFFTLLNKNNQELPKDENGNYIAQANTGYKLTLSFNSPNGFHPGTYEYQISNGLMVDGGEGMFILNDGTNVGTWTVTDTGLITMVFNNNINKHTDITISATMGLHFPEQEDPIDFDGKITVVVEKPPVQTNPTYVNKWGNQGGVAGSNGVDQSKIYWGIEIIGNKDSQIPGNIITDRIIDGEWSKKHRFTESDIAGGLNFGASSSDGQWHNWHVSADDPHLIWTETGWTYKMPTTVICQWCGELTLGNEGWYYYIDYTSTPLPTGMGGTFGYENDVTIDGAYGYAWVNFTQGDATGEIVKNGAFVSDAEGGGFRWEFKATIPPRQEGKRADYHWYIMDNMKLLNSSGQITGLVENDAHLAKVTVEYNGTTIEVPRIQDATADDMFAWDNGWSATENGITHGREFNLLTRCQCTPDTCHWESGCGEYWYLKDDGTYATNGFCQCWTTTELTTFTFVYETHDLELIGHYGGHGYQLQNLVELFYIPEGAVGGASIDRSDAIVPIPGLFKKELTHDFDGYTANYKITINEAKVVLTDGSPLKIHDVMTDTLAFISGSLVITSEDENGNVTKLQQDVDYTVEYDGTGNQTDENGNEVHVLDITILRPQPVKYLLDYDATLIMPKNATGAIKYTNSATITLWGEEMTNDTVEKVYADINISAKNYKVNIHKTCALTNKPLAGATFGLYNSNGGLITTGVTDENGNLLFETNIIEGIVLREHVLYYMQEIKPPPGYQLDDTKHWFCFCDSPDGTCKDYSDVIGDIDAIRIPYEQIGMVNATNTPNYYNLPETGGPGIFPLILASVILIITPFVYRFIKRRKRERRRIG